MCTIHEKTTVTKWLSHRQPSGSCTTRRPTMAFSPQNLKSHMADYFFELCFQKLNSCFVRHATGMMLLFLYLYWILVLQFHLWVACHGAWGRLQLHSGQPWSRMDEHAKHPPTSAIPHMTAVSSYACSMCGSQTDPQ